MKHPVRPGVADAGDLQAENKSPDDLSARLSGALLKRGTEPDNIQPYMTKSMKQLGLALDRAVPEVSWVIQTNRLPLRFIPESCGF